LPRRSSWRRRRRRVPKRKSQGVSKRSFGHGQSLARRPASILLDAPTSRHLFRVTTQNLSGGTARAACTFIEDETPDPHRYPRCRKYRGQEFSIRHCRRRVARRGNMLAQITRPRNLRFQQTTRDVCGIRGPTGLDGSSSSFSPSLGRRG
jgi:hypothetical protein